MPKLRPTLLALAGAAILIGGTMPAAAQMICGKREAIVNQLENRYGETRRSMGYQEGRGIIETWANDDTGTWSIIMTNPEGVTCLLAAGEAFQAEAVKVAEERPI